MVTEVSILIPVYNRDVTAMVYTLLAQCKRLSVTYEILLYDDGSDEITKAINRTLVSQKRVIYHELPENIGRAAIRNKLAANARYSYLLMLDNDCLPVASNFLYNYLVAGRKSEAVIGGVAYISKAPDKSYRLHWKYGKSRGSKNATERQKEPYQDIYLCNALIRKDIFLKFPLREKLVRYGHEDTVFAHELRINNIKIKHIDNPVIHLGLEQTPNLLVKTYQAVDNLVQLYNDGEVLNKVKLILIFELLNRLKLLKAYTVLFSGIERVIHRNLNSSYPNLLLFDLYRLYLFGKKIKQPQLITV
jgi:glycosyltransferase involved in cell wall biosynthesis